MTTFRLFLMEMPELVHDYDKDDNQIHPDEKYKPKGGKLHSTTKSGHKVYVHKTASLSGEDKHDYVAVDKHNSVHMVVSGQHDEKTKRYRIELLAGNEKTTIKSHEFYHHLAHHFPLESSNEHSVGGMKTWHKLSKMSDVKMTHHNFETASGDPEHTTLHRDNDFHHNYGEDESGTRFRVAKIKKK